MPENIEQNFNFNKDLHDAKKIGVDQLVTLNF